jgi:predicted outer membrane repeat protein
VDLGDNGIGSGLQGDLRYCVGTANGNADPSNLITFRSGLTGTITLTQGKLVVTKPLEINGPGADLLTVSGNQQSGVFDIEVLAGQTVMLSDLTIADGTGAGQQFGIAAGGGLFNEAATLVLERTTFSHNTVPFQVSGEGGGGAIFNAGGIVTLTDSTITNNQAGMASGAAIRNLGTMALHHATVSANPGGSGGTIANDGTMTLEQCVIADNGSDIANTGTLTMAACTVSGNTAFTGGGLHNTGSATVTDSTFRNNSATVSGGAIALDLGEMTVSGSTIAGNTAGTFGGGITVTGGQLDLTNSTVSGNVAQAGGGIYYAQTGGAIPVLEVTSATITLNRTTGTFNLGGGIEINVSSGPARALMRNAIIAGNQAALRGPDVDGPVVSLGYNLVGQTDGGTGWVGTDLQGTSGQPLDPGLGPLQDNGGSTLTRALLAGSPAAHAGDPAVLLSRDQRGSVRAGSFGTPTDIGAFAAEPATQFRLTAPANFAADKPFAVKVVALDQWGNVASTYTGTVHFNSNDPAAQLPEDTAFSGADAGARRPSRPRCKRRACASSTWWIRQLAPRPAAARRSTCSASR